MSVCLGKIKYTGFRGVRSLTLDLEGKSAIIFGGNGTGKSSLVDGLEFFFSGRIARFTGTGTASIDERQATRHVQAGSLCKTELSFHEQAVTLTRQLESTVAHSGNFEVDAYLQKHNHTGSFILRRDQLQDFVRAHDSSRYQRFISLLGLDELIDMQEEFYEAEKLAVQRTSLLEAELNGHLDKFTDTQGLRPYSSLDILKTLDSGSRELGHGVVATEVDIVRVRTAITASSPASGDDLRRVVLAQARFDEPLPAITEMEIHEYNAVLTLIDGAERHSSEGFKRDIIMSGLRFFKHNNTSTCPLCEQSLTNGTASLVDRLEHRGAKLQTVEHLLLRKKTIAEGLTRNIDALLAQLTGDEKAITPIIGEGTGFAEMLSEATVVLNELRNAIGQDRAELPPLPQTLGHIMLLRSNLREVLSTKATTLKHNSEGKSPKLLADLTLAQNLLPAIKRTEKAIELSKLALAKAAAARAAFYTAREQAVQKIFDVLASKVCEYYASMQPGHSSDCSKFNLRPKGRSKAGGLGMAIEFFGQATGDARAYLSEAHIDMLGLAIFLASAKLFNSPTGLLVLDDVFASMDWEHCQAVTELINREFSAAQVIITTHDEQWFANTATPGWKKVRISGWSLQEGPVLKSEGLQNFWQEVEHKLTRKEYADVQRLLTIALSKTLSAAEQVTKVSFSPTSPDKLYLPLLTIAGEDKAPEDVLHALSIVLNGSTVTEKLLGRLSPTRTITVGDLRAYIQGLKILQRYLGVDYSG